MLLGVAQQERGAAPRRRRTPSAAPRPSAPRRPSRLRALPLVARLQVLGMDGRPLQILTPQGVGVSREMSFWLRSDP